MFDYTFEKFLAEKLTVPNLDDGMGKKRHGMPQLKEFDAFKADLEASKIVMKPVSARRPESLTPTQSNFSEEKVKKMVEDDNWHTKPIIISKDNYVVDGHHRWLAACETKRNIDVRQVDLTAADILGFLKDKDYVVKEGIKE